MESTNACHRLRGCLQPTMALAEATRSAADAVSNTTTGLLDGVSDGVSAARDSAQQLLDSANSATEDLQTAASGLQGSVSSSLSSAFDSVQASAASAVGTAPDRGFVAQLCGYLKGVTHQLSRPVCWCRRTSRACAAGSVCGRQRSAVRGTSGSRCSIGSAAADNSRRSWRRDRSARAQVATCSGVWWLD